MVNIIIHYWSHNSSVLLVVVSPIISVTPTRTIPVTVAIRIIAITIVWITIMAIIMVGMLIIMCPIVVSVVVVSVQH